LAGSLAVAPAASGGHLVTSAAFDSMGPSVTSYRAMRYARVIGQTGWATCGPAAVATLLTHYLEIPVSETDVLFAIAAAGAGATGRPNGQSKATDAGEGEGTAALIPVTVKPEGYTMLELKRALQQFGVDSVGYQVDLEALREYFLAGGHPVLIHLTRPQLHFAVLIGGSGGSALLGDPAFGERSMPWGELAANYGFSGYVLVPVPTPGQLATMLAVQKAASMDLADRLERLRRLGVAI